MKKRYFFVLFVLFMSLFVACTSDTDDSSSSDSEEEVVDSTSTRTSYLDMPNAFSPNGDGVNDIYRAKTNYQNIEEFEATIFDRWGVKIFSWTNIDEGWDGTYNGKDAPEGTYYVVVHAVGADHKEWNIKRDVNLMRDYTETSY